MDARDPYSLEINTSDEVKFDLHQGAIVVDALRLRFWATKGVRNLFLGVGRCFDFTCGLGGADRVYVRGLSADHKVMIDADVLTLFHEAHGTEVKLHASRGPRELIFDDGAVELGALWSSARQAVALLSVVGEAAAGAEATVASHVKASPRMAVGALPEGALLQVDGVGGLETVYAVRPGMRVHLEGRLSEHMVAHRDQALMLARRVNGLLDGSYVVGQARLVFTDGAVQAEALSHAVRFNESWPVPSGEKLSPPPRITAVALDVDLADIDWSEEWQGTLPSGVFAGCRPGQVFEASVSLEEPVQVEGFPRLHLCVGGHHRAAQYSSGSGTDTLHFIYTVCEEDVAQGSCCLTRGLTLTGSDNLNVEVGPMMTSGAFIRPLTPDSSASRFDAMVCEVEAPSESDWQALITESDRRLALSLERLGGQHASDMTLSAHARTLSYSQIDVQVDLLIDIDLHEMELVTETV